MIDLKRNIFFESLHQSLTLDITQLALPDHVRTVVNGQAVQLPVNNRKNKQLVLRQFLHIKFNVFYNRFFEFVRRSEEWEQADDFSQQFRELLNSIRAEYEDKTQSSLTKSFQLSQQQSLELVEKFKQWHVLTITKYTRFIELILADGLSSNKLKLYQIMNILAIYFPDALSDGRTVYCSLNSFMDALHIEERQQSTLNAATLKSMVMKNMLEAVITKLGDFFKHRADNENLNTLILNASNLEALNKRLTNRLINFDEYDRENSRIQLAILELIDDIDSKEYEPV